MVALDIYNGLDVFYATASQSRVYLFVASIVNDSKYDAIGNGEQ